MARRLRRFSTSGRHAHADILISELVSQLISVHAVETDVVDPWHLMGLVTLEERHGDIKVDSCKKLLLERLESVILVL